MRYTYRMRIHRFYIKELDNTSSFIEDADLIHQLTHVFRYKTGDIVSVFNEKLGEWEAEITDIHKKRLSFKYIRQTKIENPAEAVSNKSVLYMSIIKNSNFDLVVEKATELGITEVVPITTERTIKTKLNYSRLNKIIQESTEQCGRIDLMKVGEILVLSDAIAQAKLYSEEVFFGHINDANMNHPDPAKNNALFVGPEGGWSEEEIALFSKEKIVPISLSQNVLRAETAAIIGASRLV